ncbi:MAG: UDP-N-acetylmuramoyl-L-alanyl-D-glutamate--2,6-diaminopimelate ligase [Thermodesulfobacteriota bacterium]
MPPAIHTSPRKTLRQLLDGLPYDASPAAGPLEIAALAADSREVVPGTLFLALPGTHVDGHAFVGQAIERGAAAVVVQAGHGIAGRSWPVPVVRVADSRQAAAAVAAAFWDHPEAALTLVGITGTNGKTTVSFLVESMLRAAGLSPGVIGTVSYRYAGRQEAAPFTTPGPLALFPVLARMRAAGVSHVVMEVSSHALAQERVAGLRFQVAAFTNLTRDHLDFHGDMEAYFAAKARLFTEHLAAGGRAVVALPARGAGGRPPAADWSDRLLAMLRQPLRCAIDQPVEVHAAAAGQTWEGIRARIVTPAGVFDLGSPLVGSYNLANLLVAAGIGVGLGLPLAGIERGLAALAAVPGRLERVPCRAGVQVFVDYAHTPDALASVLGTLRELGPARLVVVFGCGGDRDAGKRPQMGRIAGELADIVLVTSDNPRSEAPEAIMAAIERGLAGSRLARNRAELLLSQPGRTGYDLVPCRRQAIATAVSLARPGDVVLIAGKGHETYQIIGGSRRQFDDRLQARLATLAAMATGPAAPSDALGGQAA